MKRNTIVSIEGDAFRLNGRPTYEGRTFREMKIEGLLLNSRMVQGIFDDLNDETRSRWDYPDGPWDADRNTSEFIAAMAEWKRSGLVAFTINLQGGSPQGYSKTQPWVNSAFAEDGALRPAFMARLEKILDAADQLEMAVMLGYFYFGQDQRLADEAAVIRATDNATDWLIEKQYTHVLIEICNETDVPKYDREILFPPRVGELVQRVQQRSTGKVNNPAGRLLTSVSMSGDTVPPDHLVTVSDYLLLHGNGTAGPERIREMVDQTRAKDCYAGQPIVFNEDDHYDFDADDNHFIAAVGQYAGWGFFDYRQKDEGFAEGYQCIPCDWGIGSARKRGFFGLLAKMTGAVD